MEMKDLYKIAKEGLDLPKSLEQEINSCFEDECECKCDDCDDCEGCTDDLEKKFETAISKGKLVNLAVCDTKKSKIRQFSLIFSSLKDLS